MVKAVPFRKLPTYPRALPWSGLRLLDVCCGGGAASEGYHRSGRFSSITGVDHNRAAGRHYPFDFVHADAIQFLSDLLDDPPTPFPYDVIHASFPCQKFTRARHLAKSRLGYFPDHPDLLTPGRVLLQALHISERVHYVMENVPGAPLEAYTVLCGSQFDLAIERHRLFEASFEIPEPPHGCRTPAGEVWGIYGSMRDDIPDGGRTARSLAHAQELMDVDWLSWSWLREAVPPAYTEYISSFIP